MSHKIHIARIYDADDTTGARLLVDRIWPRGISKQDAALDAWIREVAPSDDLRTWFGHDADKWGEFRRRYEGELSGNEDAVEECLDWCRKGAVTLLYSARDTEHNQAVVLRDYLRKKLGR